MTHSMINYARLGLTLCLLFTVNAQDPNLYKKDFSTWAWVQLEKKMVKKQYINFQYQIRFDNNSTTFNRSNFYFTYGCRFNRFFNTEVLYQWNVNRVVNQNTFYVGNTSKFKINSVFQLHYRMALQHTVNHFSSDFAQRNPMTEWRNRLRFNWKVSPYVNTSISAEPYVAFDKKHPAFMSRTRYVAQLGIAYNKYQTFTIFYLYQKDIRDFGNLNKNYVIGITNSIKLPNKLKKMNKFYQPTIFKSKKDETDHDTRDVFN